MKRKKRLVLTALIACLGVFLSVGIYLVAPKFLAGDTQVTDLTLKSQVNEQTIQLTMTDQNQADTKVVVPLAEKLSYTPTKQTNAGVTYDQVNHQIVIDWLANHPKTVNLTVKAKNAGTYVFKAQTTREQMPCNSAPVSATVKVPEIVTQSSSLSSSVLSNSSQLSQPIASESASQSTEVVEKTPVNQNTAVQTADDNLNHSDTDIVTPEALDNSEWLLKTLKDQGINISAGKTTYGDLKKVTALSYVLPWYTKITGNIPRTIKYFTNLQNLTIMGKNNGTHAGVTGNIPKEIGELKELACLNLSYTDLTGELPDEIGKLPKLKQLVLSGSQFTGEITNLVSILNRPDFTDLRLDDTYNLVGAIPVKMLQGADPIAEIANSSMTALEDYDWSTIAPSNNGAFVKTSAKILDQGYWYLGNYVAQKQYQSSQNGNGVPNPVTHAFSDSNAWSGDKSWIGYAMEYGDELQVFDDGGDFYGPFRPMLGSRDSLGVAVQGLSKYHTYQISDSSGKLLYDGPADPSLKLKPDHGETQFVIRMDHTKVSASKTNMAGGMVIEIRMATPKVKQSIKPEDSNIGTDNNVRTVVNKPFNMITTIVNNDTFASALGSTKITVKDDVQDKVAIDSSSFAMQKQDSTDWTPVTATNVSQILGGYQVNWQNLNLDPKEQVKLRYAVTASQPFNDTSVLVSDTKLSTGAELDKAPANFVIKHGELAFVTVPATMSFEGSSILGTIVELNRQKTDWTMQVEDTRLKKNDWHVTMQLTAPFKNSANDTLPDSLIYRKSGESDQIIGMNAAVDAYDGHSTDAADYYDIKWAAGNGPLLKVRPGVAKLGQYQGVMEWTLVDGPA